MNRAEQILNELAENRRAIEFMESERTRLYARQRELSIEGDELGLSAAEMARAMQPLGKPEDLAEKLRQDLREHRGPQTAGSASRRQAKRTARQSRTQKS